MYNTYIHYDIEVVRQVTGTPFTSSLSKAGIDYIELPVIAPLVVMYTKDEVKKYAVIVPCSIPDDYQEIVYVTTEIPADLSWQNLIDDTESQYIDGAAPKIMQSRLKMLLDTAYSIAFERLADIYPAKDMFSQPEIPEAELYQETKLELFRLGCDIDYLKSASAHDVDTDFLNLIIRS